MAADMALLENLERTFDNLEIIFTREELNSLRQLTRDSQGPIKALERGDYLHDDLRRGQVRNLSTLLYRVDDLLDQILTFEHRGQVRVLLHSPKQFFFHLSKARRVAKIRNQIESLVRQLPNDLEHVDQPHQRQLQPIEGFKPAKHKLIGRETDKNNIVNMLLQTPESVSVIWMYGVTGVGKTALTKDIYEDVKVKSHFDLRMWIPVSPTTDEAEIIQEIVESCTNRRSNYSDNSISAHHHHSLVHENGWNLFRNPLGCRSSSVDNNAHQYEIDIYERRLKNEIRGKRYLLVLDNVDLEKLQRLRDLLAGGAKGSHILVTSQNNQVADLEDGETPYVKAYPLQGLTEEHSWTLFKRIAFDVPFDDEREMMGSEIAKMCNHIPFTVKVAASFIRDKDMNAWSAFVEKHRLIKGENEDVMKHILHLSLSNLPTHLRACFGYCSLFPEDFTFDKHDLISLWIAQGFVYPHDGRSLDDVGEMYFKELSQRCFVEKERTDYLGNILTCKMHHIVRNLAFKLTAGVDNIRVTDETWIQDANSTLKHIYVNCSRDLSSKLASPLFPFPSLRTLILVKEPDCDIKVDTLVFNQLISSYNRLRVLDLHDLGLKELPHSIGEQIHLRYLDLSGNDGLVTLPKSLTRLHNLQTLKLNSCPNLKRLASDFGLLVNLQRLEVDECDRLTCMPLGLGELIQLERLSRFVVGKGSSKQGACAGLEALSGLTSLRGLLAIEFTGDLMPYIPEGNQADVGYIRNIRNISELNIRWAQNISDIEIPSEEPPKEVGEAHEKILEHLQPYSGLKTLRVEGYKGGNFPSWARGNNLAASLPALVILTIEGCDKCEFLPPFGELSNLTKLTLRYMTNVRYVEEPAQEGNQDRPLFESLEELTLHNFYHLEGWRKKIARLQQPETRSFPRLSKLRIWNCPNLRSLPSFPKVKDLKLRNVHQFLLDDCARRASSHMNRIGTESLKIKAFPSLEGFEVVSIGLGGLPSLKLLAIEKCDALSSLASDLTNITSLETLKISSCKELDLSEESHSTYNPVRWRKLKYLKELTLIDIPKMKVLPEGLKHVITLKMLCISACQSLGTLPEWMGCLSSLQQLRIESCHSLKTLPQGLKDVKSLLKVEIIECSAELMERCQEPSGSDWPYIKHARVVLHKSWRYGNVSHPVVEP